MTVEPTDTESRAHEAETFAPPEAQAEHRWLKRLIGEWTADGHTPDAAPMTETGRALGDLWVVLEGKGEMPDGTPSLSILTLGFDPAKGRFVGSWVGSMMTHFWVYEGSLDDSGQVLTLDCEGPDWDVPGRIAPYQDIIELIGDDRRTLTARMQAADGTWNQLMVTEYRRKQ